MAERVAGAGEIRVRRALAQLEALKHIGEDLLGKAVNLAPVEEGTLRGSATLAFIVNGDRYEGEHSFDTARGRVRELALAGELRRVDVEVAFTTVYAARQHEELSWHHPLGGQAKYLEQPLREGVPRYMRILELADRRALS